MPSLNKVMLIGHLGRDPETRYTTNGTAVVNVSLATTYRYKDQSGQQQEETEWHSLVFFGRQAEVVSEYLRKGSAVYVEGRLRTRKWTDKRDSTERHKTEIIVETLQMLGKREGAPRKEQAPPQPSEPPQVDDSDIPF